MNRYIIFSILAVFTLQTCCKGPVEPDYKNPREYIWTATQLTFGGGSPSSIYAVWGSTPRNVYAAGFSFLGGKEGALYHYNGNQWSNVANLPSPDYNELREIFGFGENDIWIAGARYYTKPEGGTLDSAAVFHYNGYDWTQVLPFHMGLRGLSAGWGDSPQNLYFGSADGKILHFNGANWSIDTLHVGLFVAALGGDNENIFAMGTVGDSVMFFKRTNGTWQLVDWQFEANHEVNPHFGLYAMYSPSPGVHYSSGYGVFRWNNDAWEKVLSGLVLLTGIGGSGTNNILAVGRNIDGPAIYHWDGAGWEEINLPDGTIPEDILLYGIWTNGREAFIVGNSAGVSYVLHGK